MLKTIEALSEERDEDEKIWGSMIKQAIKRQRPGFNESYHGFRSFSELLEEARTQRLIESRKGREVRGLHRSGGQLERTAEFRTPGGHFDENFSMPWEIAKAAGAPRTACRCRPTGNRRSTESTASMSSRPSRTFSAR